MDSTDAAPITIQQRFWNDWNAAAREHETQDVSVRQAEVVSGWLDALGRTDLTILEVGCGSGWFCPQLARYGCVTGTDLSDEVLARAQKRVPEVNFVAGDFMELDFEPGTFDVLVALEVLSHIADQPAFVSKLASLLRPGGHLMLATQNRFVLERFNDIPPPGAGQLRQWVDRHELRTLLQAEFDVKEIFSVSPKANKGLMRIINSRKVNLPLRMLFGSRIERLKESLGLGWTLMALGCKAA